MPKNDNTCLLERIYKKITRPKTISWIIGERVKEEREKCGITQEQLAESVNVSSDTIKRIEKGKGLKAYLAYNIAEVLCVPVNKLFPQKDLSKNELLERIQDAEDILKLFAEKINNEKLSEK